MTFIPAWLLGRAAAMVQVHSLERSGRLSRLAVTPNGIRLRAEWSTSVAIDSTCRSWARLQGGPTVILDAGLDSFSTSWYWVQTALAGSMRVVAYDRTGPGWSDAGVLPRDGHHSAADLHTALQGAGIDGPTC